MTKKTIIFLTLVVIIFACYFLAAPATINPASYHPDYAPEMIKTAPNRLLTSAQLIGKDKLSGPEDVEAGQNGLIITGLENGDIASINTKGEINILANTKGRPLGLHHDQDNHLMIADGKMGLLQLSAEGNLVVLTNSVDGRPLGLVNDLDIAADGTVYFSESSWKWPLESYRYDALEARAHGSLLSYNPDTEQTRVVLDGLYYANGVALSANEDFVLVAETFRYRIRRYWLSGPKAGSNDLFIDNLPGFPDGISANRQGTFWAALASPRNPVLDYLHPLPWLKGLITKLPAYLQPQPISYGLILGLNEAGEITHNLQDSSGQHLYSISSVQQVEDRLLIGTLYAHRVGRFHLTGNNLALSDAKRESK